MQVSWSLAQRLLSIVAPNGLVWIRPELWRQFAVLAERGLERHGLGAEKWLDLAFEHARNHRETYFTLLAARDLARLYEPWRETRPQSSCRSPCGVRLRLRKHGTGAHKRDACTADVIENAFYVYLRC